MTAKTKKAQTKKQTPATINKANNAVIKKLAKLIANEEDCVFFFAPDKKANLYTLKWVEKAMADFDEEDSSLYNSNQYTKPVELAELEKAVRNDTVSDYFELLRLWDGQHESLREAIGEFLYVLSPDIEFVPSQYCRTQEVFLEALKMHIKSGRTYSTIVAVSDADNDTQEDD